MTDYTKSTNFATKDSLPPGSALKIVRGTEIDTEFNAIATAVATKANSTSPTLSGGTIDNAVIGGTTAAAGSFTTLAASSTITGTKLIPTGTSVTGNGMYLPAANTLGFSTNGTNAVTIDSSQNVGVGVTPAAWGSPYKALQFGPNGGSLNARTDSNQAVELALNWYYDGAATKYIYSNYATKYRQYAGAHEWSTAPFGTAGNTATFTQAMTLDASNNLLVGGTFGSGLQVFYNNNDVINSRSGQAAGTSRSLYTGWYSATSTTQGTLCFNVTTNGNVTNTNNSYGAISDIKLKENITDATPKLEKLCQVRVVNYNFKEGQTHKQLGVIAQELEQVFPAMVEETADKDMEGNDLGTTTKSVKYSVFVPMLIKAIQEQQALISSQAAAITTLTERITALEAK